MRNPIQFKYGDRGQIDVQFAHPDYLVTHTLFGWVFRDMAGQYEVTVALTNNDSQALGDPSVSVVLACKDGRMRTFKGGGPLSRIVPELNLKIKEVLAT